MNLHAAADGTARLPGLPGTGQAAAESANAQPQQLPAAPGSASIQQPQHAQLRAGAPNQATPSPTGVEASSLHAQARCTVAPHSHPRQYAHGDKQT